MKAVFIGYDPREEDAVAVALNSIVAKSPDVAVLTMELPLMRRNNIYWRPHRYEENQLYDVISNAPMSTQFSLSRFWTVHAAREIGADLALFIDADFMCRGDIDELFDLADPRFAVQVVKHRYQAADRLKMDGQQQTRYDFKNWSSCMLFHVNNPALNRIADLEYLNAATGMALHQFRWIDHQSIGELPPEWNHLIGEYPPNPDAKMVHFTLGVPSMRGYENCEHAEEWKQWAAKSHLS